MPAAGLIGLGWQGRQRRPARFDGLWARRGNGDLPLESPDGPARAAGSVSKIGGGADKHSRRAALLPAGRLTEPGELRRQDDMSESGVAARHCPVLRQAG